MSARFHVAGLDMEKEDRCPFCGAELKEEHFHGDEDNGFGTLKRYWTCETCNAQGAALYDEQNGNCFEEHELYKLGWPHLEKVEPDGAGVQIGPMRIPTSEEWDKLMDAVHEDDAVAHWNKMYSWAKDYRKFDEGSSCRTFRGYNSARYWGCYYATHQDADVGFRPVFEILGNDTLAPDIQDGDAVVAGTLYMNGVPVQVPQNPTSDGNIEDYVPGAALEMRATLDDPAYQVKAIKVGNILVADRNLLKRISYMDIEKALFPPGTMMQELFDTIESALTLAGYECMDVNRKTGAMHFWDGHNDRNITITVQETAG